MINFLKNLTASEIAIFLLTFSLTILAGTLLIIAFMALAKVMMGN